MAPGCIGRKRAVQDGTIFGVKVCFPSAVTSGYYHPPCVFRAKSIGPIYKKAAFCPVITLDREVIPLFSLNVVPGCFNQFVHCEPIEFVRSIGIELQLLDGLPFLIKDNFGL